MKLEIVVSEADVEAAYRHHLRPGVWWLDPAHTPLAYALQAHGAENEGARASYETFSIQRVNGSRVGLAEWPLPDDARRYMRLFGDSLLGPLSAEKLATIRALHKTSSDHADEVAAPRKRGRVGPARFVVYDDAPGCDACAGSESPAASHTYSSDCDHRLDP